MNVGRFPDRKGDHLSQLTHMVNGPGNSFIAVTSQSSLEKDEDARWVDVFNDNFSKQTQFNPLSAVTLRWKS